MNENLDLTKILKNCPKGTKLYSTIFGEVEFDRIEKRDIYSVISVTNCGTNCNVTSDGRYCNSYNGECTLFPSKEQRDWNKFTAPWYKKEQRNNVHFYVARDKGGGLWLYIGKPSRGNTEFYSDLHKQSMALTCYNFKSFGLNKNDYANLKWEDGPVEVFVNMED